jgi:hypothetical protein
MRAFFLATEKVPKPTIVTLRPFFSEALMPAISELKAASACDLVSPTSFAIFPTRSPLFKEPPLSAPRFIKYLGIARVIALQRCVSQAKSLPEPAIDRGRTSFVPASAAVGARTATHAALFKHTSCCGSCRFQR